MVGRKHPWTVYLYGLAPVSGGFAFGYDTGSVSGVLTMTQFIDYMGHPGNFTQGGITASIQAGAFAGSLLTGLLLADRIGRKKTLLFGSALFSIGIAISAAANGIPCLIAGRVINGLGNGCLAMMVPLYQSEISPLDIRGRVISVQQCAINLGILVAFLIQYGTSHVNNQASWRVPLALQLVPTLLLHFTMYFMPESPRWLVNNDRVEDALTVLAKVHTRGDTADPYVKAELAEIVSKIEWEKSNPPPTYLGMLFGSEKRRTWIGIGVQFWQQVTGINT
jgi:sugar porter (SP) family MFS transporter